MDSALSKIGLYDFFGLLLVGMIAIASSIYLKLPFTIWEQIDSDAIKIVLFFLESYFIGFILQEASSRVDYFLFQINHKAESVFLNEINPVTKNPLELKDFRQMSNIILGKEENNTVFSRTEQMYVYHYCEDYLYVKEKKEKVSTISSWNAMSRSLMLLFPVLTLYYIFVKKLDDISFFDITILCFLTLICYYRTKRLSAYRVRTVLRYYRALIRQNSYENS